MLEQILGVLFLFNGGYKLTKLANSYCRLIYGYYRYARISQNRKNKIGGLFENPSRKEEVHLEINFKAHKNTFRHHFN